MATSLLSAMESDTSPVGVDSKTDSVLRQIYFDVKHPASYSAPAVLHKAARKQLARLSLKTVQLWLLAQRAYALHRRPNRRFTHRRTITSGINRQWQIDLVDVQKWSRSNKGFKHLLTCIDIFSKRAWVKPVKDKQSSTVAAAFATILKDAKPVIVQSDRGSEFIGAPFQKLLKQHGIRFFCSSNPDVKSSVVERFNRTIRQRLTRYQTHHNSDKYYHVIADINSAYNNTYHRSIKCTPMEVGKHNEAKVWKTLFGGAKQADSQKPFRFNINDRVRIVNKRGLFHRGYSEQFTSEIFVVKSRKMFDQAIYKIVDLQEEPIFGLFYEAELLFVPPLKSTTNGKRLAN